MNPLTKRIARSALVLGAAAALAAPAAPASAAVCEGTPRQCLNELLEKLAASHEPICPIGTVGPCV